MRLAVGVVCLLMGGATKVGAQTRIDVPGRMGGHVSDHVHQYRALAQQGYELRVPPGECRSACTTVLGLQKDRVCISPGATLMFHKARLPDQTAVMWGSYPLQLRNVLLARGGLPDFGRGWLRLDASDLWALGFRRC